MNIYTHERGVERIDSHEDLEDNSTIVVATLMPGIDHAPISLDQIENIYCPSCFWLDPDEPHHDGCEYARITFI